MRHRRVLAVTGGHPFDRAAFEALLDAACSAVGCSWEHRAHPDPAARLRPELADRFDAVLLHDIPGLRLARGEPPLPVEPTEEERAEIDAFLSTGVGLVALHHALAGWPSWDRWADVLGGRFLYAPGRWNGRELPASGYRMGTYRVEPIGHHPVTDGIEPFDVDDELYLCPIELDRSTPLLRTDADLSAASMLDAYTAVLHSEHAPAAPQPASPVIGWARRTFAGRVVTLLPGHTGSTMAHPSYRRLVANALVWVSNDTG